MAVADSRRDKRFRLTEPAEGALRVFADVVMQQGGDDRIRPAGYSGNYFGLPPVN
jgi:hypothetical protein